MDNDERGCCLGELLHYSLDSRVLFSEENDVLHKMYVQHGQNITVNYFPVKKMRFFLSIMFINTCFPILD